MDSVSWIVETTSWTAWEVAGGALSVALAAREEARDLARVAPARELGVATRAETFHDLYAVRPGRLTGYHE